MSGSDAYRVDLEELDAVIGDLERLERELEGTTNDLEAQMATLHGTWEGETAVAQREAHQEWEAGMTAMRGALAQMRSAARTAHGNYTKAVDANRSMWEGLG
jgi:WXG100 family type VII secretion target